MKEEKVVGSRQENKTKDKRQKTKDKRQKTKKTLDAGFLIVAKPGMV
jgi:hypothetical protein